ncbi:MAG: hypothetical protein D4R69_02050 [Actinomycetales bacterium]|nr:MAG: hypothetical protein D4R69_02050 [Actinomycetales bacterium]
MATSCSSGNEKASSEPTVSPPTEIVTSSPTPDPTPTPAVSPTTEPSSTPTTSTQPKTKESKSVVTPSATPTPKKSKATSKPSPSTNELTPAQMLVKYPPTIGVVTPWYKITPEQAGKAYTDVKPYEVGLTYALYQIGNDMLYIHPRWNGSTVTWDSVLNHNVDVKAIKVTELFKNNLGGLLIAMEWCDIDGCGVVSLRTDVDLSKLAQLDPNLKQTWEPTKVNR